MVRKIRINKEKIINYSIVTLLFGTITVLFGILISNDKTYSEEITNLTSITSKQSTEIELLKVKPIVIDKNLSRTIQKISDRTTTLELNQNTANTKLDMLLIDSMYIKQKIDLHIEKSLHW